MSTKQENPSVPVKTVHSFSKGLNVAATIALVFMMLISVVDVLSRSIFKYALPDSQEAIQFLMVCLGFWAMAWCAVKGSHVAVDLLVNRFSIKAQTIFDIITRFLGFCICALISWRTFLEVPLVLRLNEGSIYLKIPAYPFYFALALGVGVLALVMLTRCVQLLAKAVKR